MQTIKLSVNREDCKNSSSLSSEYWRLTTLDAEPRIHGGLFAEHLYVNQSGIDAPCTWPRNMKL